MPLSLETHPLHRADGSATFTSNLFTITAAANGPIEVQRRDELPEEAAIEVNVRPASGVGGPRERWMESVLASLLRSLLLVHMHPRTLMQVTLQVVKEPSVRLRRGVADVATLPALANAAFAALVDGGMPLERTMVATLGIVNGDGKIVVEPSEKEMLGVRSVHVLAFSQKGEVLMCESKGSFEVETWREVVERLQQTAMDAVAKPDEGESMGVEIAKEPWLRQTLEGVATDAGAWRESG